MTKVWCPVKRVCCKKKRVGQTADSYCAWQEQPDYSDICYGSNRIRFRRDFCHREIFNPFVSAATVSVVQQYQKFQHLLSLYTDVSWWYWPISLNGLSAFWQQSSTTCEGAKWQQQRLKPQFVKFQPSFFNLGHFSQWTQSSSGFELHIIDDKSTLKLKTGAMVQFF